MKIARKHIVSLAVFIILLAISVFLILPVEKSTRLGLDLKGGMYIVFKAKPPKDQPLTRDSVDQARFILEQRVDKLGVAEAPIYLQGEDNIIVELPGIKDPQKALDLIGKVALLEFKAVEKFDDKGNPVLGETMLTGKYLKKAAVGFDQLGKPKIDMEFTAEGAKLFEESTGKLVGKHLAIVLDGDVMSSPRVIERIKGGRAEITGNFTIEEAKNLVIVLQTGALPVHLDVLEKQIVGPTLGKESLQQALVAALAGLALVALYMLFFYRGMGIVAGLSLIAFGIIFWGVISGINRFTSQGWPLNLPAMAGVILMIGVAADSCVVIFERVKEEIRSGKKLTVAVETGFSNSIVTIIDADLVTFLVAMALAFIGIGPVRGFAVALAAGIIIDLVVTYIFTRSFLAFLVRVKPFDRPAVLGARQAVETK